MFRCVHTTDHTRESASRASAAYSSAPTGGIWFHGVPPGSIFGPHFSSEITARFEFANVQRYIRGGISGCGFSAARNSEYRSAVKLYTKGLNQKPNGANTRGFRYNE